MKLVTFEDKLGTVHTGWLKGEGVVGMKKADPNLPNDMLSFIDDHERYFKIIKDNNLENVAPHYQLSEVKLLAPLTNPRSFRDYVAFEEHMLNASKTFGHTVSPEWYNIPIFYFTNHQAIFGPNDEIKRPEKETKFDIELELAVIIGKKGNDIQDENADDYIFGYTIFNDWTARAIQRQEMTVPLGPHKGKDFANAIGPCIVTKDEFEKYRCTISRETHPEHLQMPHTTDGRFDLKMTARINGETICEGNYKTVYWTFPQMIKRASENNVSLMPGDILGSGTVGWGSLIEKNFSVHRSLEPGDIVELEIENIGILKNTVV
ncbi:fumarylacetoacetate hydrolase family protein [Winogradskyella echinorum]|uniref:Fumarylacetoacetate hydrolase family protein n=1 Tax=Winogradskyella echinorum TaxID=538189 RepID=A0ABR6Y0X8_9FLAO|nr:fumarylacetoacetate hydrolase family protein [Winogradskyella echinorum]MBC3846319.1 fumarylacetoacetate hydrolase family protein [Winogradskyella echinorum]MBC5750667.1 fumarylacetoacetate hydrolase family protein [Winogradskyella echinorum]